LPHILGIKLFEAVIGLTYNEAYQALLELIIIPKALIKYIGGFCKYG